MQHLLLYAYPAMTVVPVSRQTDVLPESCRFSSAPHIDITNMGKARSDGTFSPPEPAIWVVNSGPFGILRFGGKTKSSETFPDFWVCEKFRTTRQQKKTFLHLDRIRIFLAKRAAARPTTAVGSLVFARTITSTLLQKPRMGSPRG